MVILVGQYPPPYGGNSIHIQRLQQLCKTRGVKSVVLSPYGGQSNSDKEDVVKFKGNKIFSIFKLIVKLRGFKKPQHSIVHIHATAFENFKYVGIPILYACRDLKKVLTIHGGGFVKGYQKSDLFSKKLIRYLVKKFDKIITVNDEQKELIITHFGIKGRKIIVIPAFLPPQTNGNSESCESAYVIEVKKLKAKFDKLALVTGCILPFYGFHDIIDALIISRKLGANLGLIFVTYADYSLLDKKYESELLERLIKIPGVLVLREITPEDFIEVIRICDVFIRPTYEDGDSVALREAIYYGKQIVASNPVKRPDGCILFKTGDPNDLAKKLVDVTNNKNLGIVLDTMMENGDKILKIYKELSGEP